MKKQNHKKISGRIFILMAATLFLSCGNDPTPVTASLKISPLKDNPFCQAGSVGEMCRDVKGALAFRILSANNQFNTYTQYKSSSTLSNGKLINSGAPSNEFLLIGSSTTADELMISVPNRLSYSINFRYMQYGGNNPSPSNSSCPNCFINNQYMCRIWEKSLSFNKGVKPSTANTTVDPNNWTLPGCIQGCTL